MSPAVPLAATPHASDDQIPDQVLVARILAGAKGDFALLMRRYNQRLFRTARAIARQDSEAEDIVQQAWLAAYRALGSFRGDASLATWLTRITINEALAQVRGRTRRGELFTVEAGEDMASHDRSPEEELSARETVRMLESHIDALPEALRLVFIMRDVEELDTAETAAVLGISEGAVRVRLHRARQLLQATVSETMHLATPAAFHFDGERCDRIVAAVMAALDG